MTTERTISVITGGAGGIGSAIAAWLLRENQDRTVVLLDIAAGASDPLREKYGDRVEVITGDTSNPEHIASAFEQVDEIPGRLVSLVNAAGNVNSSASVDLSYADWRSVISTHLDSAFLASQATGRRLIENGQGGGIVNISSVSGFFGHPKRLPYATAKAGLMEMARTLAVEWAPFGIRVNTVAPGYVNTPLVAKVTKLGLINAEKTNSWHALGRIGTPEEVASAVAYLLSDQASFITGATLNVDGGFSVLKTD